MTNIADFIRKYENENHGFETSTSVRIDAIRWVSLL